MHPLQQQLMSLNTEQGMDEAQQRKQALNVHRMKNALFAGMFKILRVITPVPIGSKRFFLEITIIKIQLLKRLRIF